MRPCLDLTEPLGPGCDTHHLHRPESRWQFEPRVQLLSSWFPERASCVTYLQWDTILAKLQGRGQGADHHISPEFMLADLTTHGHVHSHAVCHSAQPNMLKRQTQVSARDWILLSHLLLSLPSSLNLPQP